MPAKTSKPPAKAAKATSSPAKAKKTAAPAAKKAPATATKPAAKSKASPSKVAKPAASPKAPKSAKASPLKPSPKPVAAEAVITRDMIATRAYFIGERRQMMGWNGDSSTDWIEAESQLIAEAKRKKKS